jgi:hypothetical protein
MDAEKWGWNDRRREASLRRLSPRDRRALEEITAKAERMGMHVLWLNGYGTIAISPDLAADAPVRVGLADADGQPIPGGYAHAETDPTDWSAIGQSPEPLGEIAEFIAAVRDQSLYAGQILAPIAKYFGVPYEWITLDLPEGVDFPATLAAARAYEVKDAEHPAVDVWDFGSL